MRRGLVVAGVLAIVAAAGTAIGIGLNGDERAFTLAQVEASFDRVGLDVEPAEPYRIVFLEPTGEEDFNVVVFDDAGEASWAQDELERQQQSNREFRAAVGAPPGFTLRRANVLVSSDSEVSQETIGKIEQALERLDRYS